MTTNRDTPLDTLAEHALAEQRAGRTSPLDQVRREVEDQESEPTTATISALASIRAERLRQQEKWGTQHHSWPEWMAILGEEYGEACKEAVEMHWQGVDIGFSGLRKELIHLAAVAVQIIERIDEVQR